jgi:hypothetical protein
LSTKISQGHTRKNQVGEWVVAQLNASTKEGFIAQWKSGLGLVHARLPAKGFGELFVEHPEDRMALVNRGITKIEYAISEDEQFFALRTHHCPTSIRPSANWSMGAQSEVFFLAISPQEVRFGTRCSAWVMGDGASIDADDAEIQALDWINEMDGAWVDWLTLQGVASAVGDAARTPCFVDLVALLLTNGQCCADFSSMRATIFEQNQLLLQSQQEVSDLNDENRRMRHQMGSVTQALSGLKSATFVDAGEEDQDDEESSDLAWLADWSEANASRIVVLPRALGAAKKSRYKNSGHIRSALEFLAGAFRRSRLGEIDQETLNKALAETGCGLRGSAGMSVAGAEGDSYFVNWSGRRRFLDLHITRGGGRDQRYCMRIYFFGDADSQKVVVGHLPSHLNNSLA